MKKRIALLCLLLTAPSAFGELLRTPYTGIRPLGMGNAFLAISDDSNAIWYNPAGLTRVKDFHFNFIDTSMGVDSLDTLNRLGNALFNNDTQNLFRPDKEYLRFNFRPTLTIPYFSVSFFSHLNSYLEMNNLESLSGTMQAYINNDIGIAAGLAIPLGPYLSIGATGRAFQRMGVDMNTTTLDLLTQLGVADPSQVLASVFTYMYSLMGSGLGLALDLGVQASLPLPKGYPKVTFAAVMNDFGATSFLPISGRNPSRVLSTVHFGSALEYDLGKRSKLNFAFDVRNAFDPVTFVKKVGFGVEYKHKYFGLRGGVWQGYLTGGASIEFPPHTRLHFSTHAVELSNQMWGSSQRWYQVQLILGFNPN